MDDLFEIVRFERTDQTYGSNCLMRLPTGDIVHYRAHLTMAISSALYAEYVESFIRMTWQSQASMTSIILKVCTGNIMTAWCLETKGISAEAQKNFFWAANITLEVPYRLNQKNWCPLAWVYKRFRK